MDLGACLYSLCILYVSFWVWSMCHFHGKKDPSEPTDQEHETHANEALEDMSSLLLSSTISWQYLFNKINMDVVGPLPQRGIV